MIHKVLKLVRRLLFWFSTIVMALLLFVFLLLQLPSVQNRIISGLVDIINTKVDGQISFRSISISWFDFLSLKELKITDYNGNVLINAATVDVDYNLMRMISKSSVSFDEATVIDGALNLTKYKDTLDINLAKFVNDLNANQAQDTTRNLRVVKIDKINLKEFVFRYDNRLKDSLDISKLDYSHLTWNLRDATIEDFNVLTDSINLKILGFQGMDSVSGFKIDELTSDLVFFKRGLYFDSLNLKTPHSHIKNSLHLDFQQLADVNSFIDNVILSADLDEAVIGTPDLMYFVDSEIPKTQFSIDTKLEGSIKHFDLNDFNIEFENSSISGEISIDGLPNLKESFVQLSIRRSLIDIRDLAFFAHELPSWALDLGNVGIKGDLIGFVNDFVSNSVISTRYGIINTDLNLKFSNVFSNASYSGRIGAEKFDLGELTLKKDFLGEINFNGKVKGKGLAVNNADVVIEGYLTQFDLLNYKYDSLTLSGEFKKKFFNGQLQLTDPEARIYGSASVDLNQSPESVDVDIEVDTLNLMALGFSERQLHLSGHIDSDITGIALDSILGAIHIYDLRLNSEQLQFGIDSVKLSSLRKNGVRFISLSAPDMNAELQGKFEYAEALSDLVYLYRDVYNDIVPDDLYAMNDYSGSNNQYGYQLHITYEDLSSYFKFFQLPLFLSAGTIEGDFQKRSGFDVNLYTKIDTMRYQSLSISDSDLDFNLAKDLYSPDVLSNLILTSKTQNFGGVPTTENLQVEATWFDKKINLNAQIQQKSSETDVMIGSQIDLMRDHAKLKINRSRIELLGDNWDLNPYNEIVFARDSTYIDRVELYNGIQSLSLNGYYSKAYDTQLNLDIKDLDVRLFNIVSSLEFEGSLNNQLTYFESRDDSTVLLSSTRLEDFRINDFLIGDINGQSSLSDDRSSLVVDYEIEREENSKILLNGNYHSGLESNPLDLQARFEEASLKMLNPFMVGTFSDIKGYANGLINISGNLDSPILEGKATVSEGGAKVDILNVNYQFDGDLLFDNEKIVFERLNLRDRENDRALLTGELRHKVFKNFVLDIDIAASDFLFLNTSRNNNSAYYGTAYGSGDIKLLGPVDDLLIDVEATTNKGTKIFIPLTSSEDFSTKEYISFVDLTDTTINTTRIQKIIESNLSGVSLDFDINVTEDAYVELIFDIRTGDIIRGRGVGSLNMKMDTNGEFDMFGELTIKEGAYNFTIPSFINKEFNIVPGSKISWYGDPYKGILDMTATYRQQASLEDFAITTNPEGSTRVPFLVKLNLDGEMLSPDINFQIEFDEDLVGTSTSDEQVLLSINEDEQELKRQVFSLLILRKFSPQNNFNIGGDALGSSVSEFLSNQFSYFVSQVDENLELDLDFDLGELDDNAFNTFQLRLSYTFFDGRLRVSGGGATVAQSEDSDASNQFQGDWSVRYILTEDGQLRVKAFSQNEKIVGIWHRETGVSLQVVKSFDDFKELLSKKRDESVITRSKDMSKEKG